MTVFISYANEDKHVAKAACANLEAAGISCWLPPRDVVPGARPHVAIMEAIDHCRVFVVIVSASTNLSLRVWLEVERAVNRGVMLIPMRIQDTLPAPALASYLVTVHWLDALDSSARNTLPASRRQGKTPARDQRRKSALLKAQ